MISAEVSPKLDNIPSSLIKICLSVSPSFPLGVTPCLYFLCLFSEQTYEFHGQEFSHRPFLRLCKHQARLTPQHLGGSGFCPRSAWEHPRRQQFWNVDVEILLGGCEGKQDLRREKSASLANSRLVVTMPPPKHRQAITAALGS